MGRVVATAGRSPKPQTASLGRWVLIIGLLLLVAVGGWALIHHRHTEANAGPAAGRRSGLPVPVITGVVTTKDVPIYLDGLGTVQAFNTVTVHSRVDGQLMSIKFEEGQDVTAGEILAELDPAPFRTQLDQSIAKKGQDEAQLANARVELDRDADLLAQKVLPQADYDTQKALVNQLQAAVNADQAAIESAKVQLDYATIRSPIDGRVGIRLVDRGNVMHAGDANGLVVITQLRPISVIFTLPEQVLPKLQQGKTDFTVFAFGRDNTNELDRGRLAVIDNQIDTTTGTIKLKATFPNEALRLWPGQFVNTRLLLATRKDGIVVPASTVQRGPEGAFAYVIKDDQSVEMRALKVAQIEGGQALIDEGLKAGESIVVDGQYKLQPGSHIKPAETAPVGARGKGRPGSTP
jgi:membrane fusion protein, multidrug efflux system